MRTLLPFFGIFILALAACERDITIDLPDGEQSVMVEGYVETGLPPYLILSRTQPFFDPIGQNTLNNLPVSGAEVTLSDGVDTVKLLEIDTVINNFAIRGFYIAVDANSGLPVMTGTPGRTYRLEVITGSGEVIRSVAKLQSPISLDSTWFRVQENLDSLGWAWARLSDPDTLGNCYRWMAKRLGKDDFFIPPFGSTFEDKFINGRSFDFAYNRGSIQNSQADEDLNEEAGFFKKGDTIVVKFSAVDFATYEFWRDAENQLGNNGSPFAVPANIKSNIQGGKGLFATYSTTYDTIIAR